MDASLASLVRDFLRASARGMDADAAASLEVASQCVSTAFGLDDNSASSSGPSLPELVDAGRKALGVAAAPAETTGKTSVDIKDPVEETPLFQKFLKNVESKGFFKGVEKGTEQYDARYQKVLAKFKARLQKSAPPRESEEDKEASALALKDKGN